MERVARIARQEGQRCSFRLRDVPAAEAERQVPRFSDDALDTFCGYHWPGNVRELENIIHRLVVMTDGDAIGTTDLPFLMRSWGWSAAFCSLCTLAGQTS